METIIKISAAALAGVLLTLMLQKQAPEHAMLTALACGVLLLGVALQELYGIANWIQKLFRYIPDGEVLAKPLMKAVGISMVTRFAGEFCRDCGQSSLGAKVELIGAAACLTAALPLADAALSLIEGML